MDCVEYALWAEYFKRKHEAEQRAIDRAKRKQGRRRF